MPYAQNHYPFENKEEFEKSMFPAQFIAEGLDQTRGWFYTLFVLATHLFDQPPFKNVIVNGLVLAADGVKMSKSKKNFPDPTLIVHSHGADALRIYLINSPVVRAEPLRFKEEGVKEVVSKVILPWFNSFKFFNSQTILYKQSYDKEFKYDPNLKYDQIMDRWLLASTQELISFVRQEMDQYRLYTVVPRLLMLIEELTNWYIRFNRKRLKGENGEKDCIHSMNALFDTLYTLCLAMAPFTPYIAENIYQQLRPFLSDFKRHSLGNNGVDHSNVQKDDSVHFLRFPEVKTQLIDSSIVVAMKRLQGIIVAGRFLRDKKTLGLKIPLKELVVINSNQSYCDDVKALQSYIMDELNVRSVTISNDESKFGVSYKVQADYKVLGTRLKKDLPAVKKALESIFYSY